MKVFLFALILVFSEYKVYTQESCCEDYCLARDNERLQKRTFTSNTAYQFVRGTDLDVGFQVPNCKAKKVWITSRHGTRLPYREIILNATKLEEIKTQILNNYLNLHKPETGALCIEDFLSIQSWKFNSTITPEMATFLTFQGWEDLKYLAITLQKIFPNIMLKEYDSEHFVFHHTQTQRTEESFKAFAEGLFGPNVYQNIKRDIVPQINDTLLYAYSGCPIWTENDWNAYYSKDTEYYKFRESETVKKTIAHISRRLGFETPLDFDYIEFMWDICRLEQAWYVNRTSIWCGAFTPAQLVVLEYLDDLVVYQTSGYGHEINSRVSCNLAKDMLKKLDNDDDPDAVAYFAHSTTIETLITALGINKDTVPLKANNFASMTDRKWKTSIIDPFASNLVAVKFECSSKDSNKDNEKAMFFLNQKRVEFDWCSQGLCDWSNVLKHYETLYKANCTEYFCSKSNGQKLTGVALTMLSFVFVTLFLLV
ncbi:multiple inositol polyphosphate phosphatase 1-like isoform X1 [Episyrphus balteatus]|uniref:multiple inositol polyphosphate phosphatase 1-like isoform X1 n=1 Tax=Episyrphus balteatus TaxID=286459 RepID=UPI002485D18C|nr:multiple inositol polyphosphate phosphatase 1-like isoform X1 [Episyrphus balteatus]